MKWDFPGELEKKAGSTEEHSHDSNPDKKDIQEGPRGHLQGRAPDAFGESGHSPGGPYAAARKPRWRACARRRASGGGPRTARRPHVPCAACALGAPRLCLAAPGRRKAAGAVHPAVWAVAVCWPWRWRCLCWWLPRQQRTRAASAGACPSAFRRAAGGGRATVSVYVTKTDTVENYRWNNISSASWPPRCRPSSAGGTQGPGHRGTDLYRAAAGVRRPRRRAGRQGRGDRYGQPPGLHRPRRIDEGMAAAREGSRAGEAPASGKGNGRSGDDI